jgi:hypothetical protein
VKTPAASALERVASRLAQVLGEDGVLVGAMAVAAHGYVRATRDVDFAVKVPLEEVLGRLRDNGIAATLRRGDVLEGDFPCLTGTIGGIRFDVMTPPVALEWNDAVEISLAGGVPLRVVDLDGLIRLKLRAQGPKDLMDAAALLLRHPEQLESARKAARSARILDKLDIWLADPRLQAEIERAVEAEKPSPKRAKKAARRRA